MPRRTPIEIIRTNLPAHPVVQAWSQLRPARVEPESIHVYRDRGKTAIYWLEGVGLDGSAVFAKRCETAVAAIERTVYEQVLPHVPVTAPHYYGWSEADGEFCWLFLEDVGREVYSELDAEHRALAGRWLGLLHTSAAGVAAAARLPDGGPGRYLEHLRSGRRTILRNLTNPALTVEGRALLDKILSTYEFLESRWSQVEEACAGVPSTLVHGDFQPQNIHIRIDRPGISLFPMDWEMAGWGGPAADLPCADSAAYWSVVRERWPSLDLPAVERLANVGRIFRWLAAIDWASRNLRFDTDELLRWPLANMRIYQTELSEAMQDAGLAE